MKPTIETLTYLGPLGVGVTCRYVARNSKGETLRTCSSAQADMWSKS